MSQPWMKYYPADWRSDPAVRMCSLAARGLWMEMLCLMHEADPYGSLIVNAKPLTPRQLASLAGAGFAEIEPLLVELEDAGVFSRDADGTIYSRRMRRDIDKAARDRANGGKGGNPKLTGRDNQNSNHTDNPPQAKYNGRDNQSGHNSSQEVNPPLKAQSQSPESESRVRKKESSSSLSAREPKTAEPPAPAQSDDDDDKLFVKVKKALGSKASGLVVQKGLTTVRAWVSQGCDFELDVLPELSEIAANLKSDLRTISAPKFGEQILARRDARLAAQQARGGQPAPAPPTFVKIETPQWEAWRAYRGAKSAPTTERHVDNGVETGWWFPTEWPPGGGAPPFQASAATRADETVLH